MRQGSTHLLLHMVHPSCNADELDMLLCMLHLQVEALRTEVALAVERADARADAQRAAHGARETALQDTANGLRTQLLEMEVRGKGVVIRSEALCRELEQRCLFVYMDEPEVDPFKDVCTCTAKNAGTWDRLIVCLPVTGQ